MMKKKMAGKKTCMWRGDLCLALESHLLEGSNIKPPEKDWCFIFRQDVIDFERCDKCKQAGSVVSMVWS